MYKISFSGNFGYTEIIVCGEESKEKLMKELNYIYNRNKINVTFNIESLTIEEQGKIQQQQVADIMDKILKGE